MKDKYTSPEMEIIGFDSEDVITASGFTENGTGKDFGGIGDIHIS